VGKRRCGWDGVDDRRPFFVELMRAYEVSHVFCVPAIMLPALAADCARDHVYECFFAANPIPFEGGVGGPINPTAIK
jgi:hypothetical protein